VFLGTTGCLAITKVHVVASNNFVNMDANAGSKAVTGIM